MRRCYLIAAMIAATAGFVGGPALAQGIIAPGAGPINRAMGGASTAAPVDFGASYWNPAILSGLERDEVLIGSELILPSIHFEGRQPAGAVLERFPPTNRFGTTRSDSGVASNLAVGSSFRLRDDSPMTLGLGIFGLVGGGVNFPASTTTPVLTPRQPPNFFGVGPVFANLSFIAIKPMASYQATDRLALAVAPVVLSGTASFSPAFFAPSPRDQFGIANFPPATNSRPFWGGGFELGLLYTLSDSWNVGFSYKSPIWQEKWTFNSYTPDLAPRRIGTQAGVPAIYSWGLAFKGIPRAIVDVDLRYFDYANTPLFGELVRDGGLNWRSVFAVAVGAQYQVTERLTLRGGYLFNTNPVNEPQTLFNIQAPGIIQNTMSMGFSLRMTDAISFSGAWVHGFRNSITGPILEIPGTSARLDAQVDSLVFGMTIQYGGKRRVAGAGSVASSVESMEALPPPPAPTPVAVSEAAVGAGL